MEYIFQTPVEMDSREFMGGGGNAILREFEGGFVTTIAWRCCVGIYF